MFRKLKKSEAGFTLIELLIVVIVLGILAGIAVPRLMGVRGKAQDAAIAAVAGTIRTAMDIYFVENDGTYPDPATVTDWASLNTALDTVNLGNMSDHNIQAINYAATDADADGKFETFTLQFESATTSTGAMTHELNPSEFIEL